MKKYKKAFRKQIILGCLVFIMAAGTGCGRNQTESANNENHEDISVADEGGNETTTPSVKPVKEPEKFDFPVALDSENLELGSVFEYSGMNPDCEDVFAEEIGAIQLKNVSGKYMKSASVKVTLSNGDELNYLVQELPADMEIMAFDTSNMVYNDSYRVEDIQVSAEYGEPADPAMVSWSVNGSDITVENLSGQEVKNVVIYYHCMIDDLGYGGKAYEMSIEALQPGESITVTDSYCFVGDVNVVNVIYE